jgi:tRNA threonylcarbamoyladenosine biosynthesis protein TsaE
VTAVEWGAGLVDQLSEERLEIAIERFADTEERAITLVPHGPDWTDRVARLT